MLGEQLKHEMSPEGATRHAWGNDKGMKRHPRVSHDTLGEQLKHEMSPEGAARQCRETTWGWNVALGDGRITGGLQDRFMEGSSATES